MKHIGFFGGTFDPIHFGHLNLAINILEKNQLNQIFFSPANFSPSKADELPSVTKQSRMEMVQLAIEGIVEFSLIDLELKREGPSYTIDTIKQLIENYPGVQFHLILGEDILSELPSWKEVETLLELAPPFIGTRPGAQIPKLPPKIQKAIEKGRTLISPMEISSTNVRERLLKKKHCRHLIPAKVLDYIRSHKLY